MKERKKESMKEKRREKIILKNVCLIIF